MCKYCEFDREAAEKDIVCAEGEKDRNIDGDDIEWKMFMYYPEDFLTPSIGIRTTVYLDYIKTVELSKSGPDFSFSCKGDIPIMGEAEAETSEFRYCPFCGRDLFMAYWREEDKAFFAEGRQ